MKNGHRGFRPANAGALPLVAELGAAGGPAAVAERFFATRGRDHSDPIANPGKLSGGELIGELFEAVAYFF